MHMIHLNLAQNLPAVLVDTHSMNRVFVNLIENALNYTPADGMITVGTFVQDACVVATISDTGIGISQADLPYIFESFFRADKARSTHTGGTGLGLAIVQKIAELHAARIEVESQLDIGTTFKMKLPIHVKETT